MEETPSFQKPIVKYQIVVTCLPVLEDDLEVGIAMALTVWLVRIRFVVLRPMRMINVYAVQWCPG